MARYGIGAEVLVKAKVVEVRERITGTWYTLSIEGNLLLDPTVPEKEIIEDGE